MTPDDMARFREAVQRRDRCVAAAVEHGQYLGIPLSTVQARVAYDAMAGIIWNAAAAETSTKQAKGDSA